LSKHWNSQKTILNKIFRQNSYLLISETEQRSTMQRFKSHLYRLFVWRISVSSTRIYYVNRLRWPYSFWSRTKEMQVIKIQDQRAVSGMKLENVVRVNRVKLNGFKVYPSFIHFGHFPAYPLCVSSRSLNPASIPPIVLYQQTTFHLRSHRSFLHLVKVLNAVWSPGQPF
jgi:hypothetical protein